MSTGNSLDFTAADLAVMRAHRVCCKDMEANAVAWVAAMFGVPLLALKVVTKYAHSHLQNFTSDGLPRSCGSQLL